MTDVVARLVDYYRQAAGNMQGLPICNPALAVEAVGFREHDGRNVGVIVTPWFMNVTVLPAPADLATWRRGQPARLGFPSGVYEFVVSAAGNDDGLIATCSLFSPMHEFTNDADARAAALAAVEALFEQEPAPKPVEPARAPAMSRRRFLRGG